jgi:hypothetical protein
MRDTDEEGLKSSILDFQAKYVVRFLKGNGLFDAGYVAHPSYVTDEELKAITRPLSIAAAGM